jgi:Outer membrane protein beta-barrel domain
MRTIIILLYSAFFITANAQKKNDNTYYNRRFHIGIKGGANLIKFDGKGWNNGMKYGFHAGGFLQLKLTNKISLQGEVLYSQIIADTAQEFSDVFDFIRFSESRATIKFDYIDVPIILNIGIGEINPLKLQLGIQYGILTNASSTVLQNGNNAFKSGQLSLLGGLLFQVGPINLTGRYLIGLDNINNVNDAKKWKRQIGQISVGFTL